MKVIIQGKSGAVKQINPEGYQRPTSHHKDPLSNPWFQNVAIKLINEAIDIYRKRYYMKFKSNARTVENLKTKENK